VSEARRPSCLPRFCLFVRFGGSLQGQRFVRAHASVATVWEEPTLPSLERTDLRWSCRPFVQSRPQGSSGFRDRGDLASTVKVAQGKPVARRGRKAKDLPETARPPTSTKSVAVSRYDMEVLRCPT
jgi:hypothetical protein